MSLKNQEGKNIREDIVFNVRENNNWLKKSTKEILKGKTVVIFGLPGAFTPTCSSSHLPRYEELYEEFKKEGVDEIYCLSVNDTFVMNEWAENQEIKNIKMLPDGNGDFSKEVEMLVEKSNLGFGYRSWRYSMLIKDGEIKKHFIEEDVEGDPFDVSDADTMIKYLNKDINIPESITIFSKKGCPFCKKAKDLLQDKGLKYNEIELSDSQRQKVLSSLTGKGKPTSPQIFKGGKLIGGLEDLEKYLEI